MPTRDGVQALLDRVKAATGPDRTLDAEIAVAAAGYFVLPPKWEGGPVGYGYINDEGTELHPGHGGDQLVRPYTSSIDAIVALIEKELPSGDWTRTKETDVICEVWWMEAEAADWSFVSERGSSTPLALCAAFLSAKLAQMQEGE